MPRVTHGLVDWDTISVGGCTIVSGANSLRTRLINNLIAEHEVDGPKRPVVVVQHKCKGGDRR